MSMRGTKFSSWATREGDTGVNFRLHGQGLRNRPTMEVTTTLKVNSGEYDEATPPHELAVVALMEIGHPAGAVFREHNMRGFTVPIYVHDIDRRLEPAALKVLGQRLTTYGAVILGAVHTR